MPKMQRTSYEWRMPKSHELLFAMRDSSIQAFEMTTKSQERALADIECARQQQETVRAKNREKDERRRAKNQQLYGKAKPPTKEAGTPVTAAEGALGRARSLTDGPEAEAALVSTARELA